MITTRVRIVIRGAVQGVGFRPFIYRLATEMGLPGWVMNSPQGVFIEVEGVKPRLDAFILRIEKEKPPRACIEGLEFSFLDPVGLARFEIRDSNGDGEKTAVVLPDIATCADCRREIFDPANRRYHYPFTNCTHCGPRFTIIEALPYDRTNTTMKKFEMCAACRLEYDNPLDRRFHAQPNACPQCGPHLELWDGRGRVLGSHHEALQLAAHAVREGRILAVKGLGGFHLMVDARSEQAVMRLRLRKHRDEKPFALMYPSLESIRSDCEVDELEQRLLLSPESPIVLLKRIADCGLRIADLNSKSEIRNSQSTIAPSVASRNRYLGVMLPYTPLHHLLMAELGFPVVATSGNLSDEPICIDEWEAIERLRGTADLFLVHNRPIVRHVDDSVIRVVMGRELVIRRARGYAPLPVHLKDPVSPVLAVGGHLKNTVAITAGQNILISQHIGDLETKEAYEAFRSVIQSFQTLYQVKPEQVVCDMHPDYLSTQYARESGIPLTEIQHHYAHVASCMAENELEEPVLGVAWDGTGYGPDGTIWGGEFLRVEGASFFRVATFRKYRLPGGARAIKEPRRTAIGLLHEILGDSVFKETDLYPVRSFKPSELALLEQMLERDVNSPRTSSAGRLFDAVASLVGLRHRISFEGQAAMELEFLVEDGHTEEAYSFRIANCGLNEISDCGLRIADLNSKSEIRNLKSAMIVDWGPMVLEILDDLRRRSSAAIIATKFHNTLAEMIVGVAEQVGEERVVLTGGCFQNRYLTERAIQRLEGVGFRPYWHQRIPPHDGGIALGQVWAAVRAMKSNKGQKTEDREQVKGHTPATCFP